MFKLINNFKKNAENQPSETKGIKLIHLEINYLKPVFELQIAVVGIGFKIILPKKKQ